MAELKRNLEIVGKSYMDPSKGSITLTGSADTEQDLAVIDNRGPRAGQHTLETVATVTANPNGATIRLKCYGSFDGSNWFALNVGSYPGVTSASYINITSSTGTFRNQVTTLAGTTGTVQCPFPWIKWTITEMTQNGAVGTVTAAVSGK